MKFKILYQENKKRKQKIVEAKTIDEVYCLENLPVNIITIAPVKIQKQFENRMIFSNKKKEIYELFKQLNIMLSANLTISESLELLLKTQKTRIIKDILFAIDNAIKLTIPMPKALSGFRKYLGDTPILFLELGIKNGNIKESINSLVEILSEDISSHQKVSEVIRYPIILFISLAISMGMIFIYVIPNFEFVFATLGDEMPFATKALLFLKDIITNYSLYLLVLSGSFYFAVLYIYKKNRILFDKIIMLHIPIFSKVVQNYSFYRLFLLISIIVKSKYQFQIAIENSKNIVTNRYVQDAMKKVLVNIKSGLSVANSFEQIGLFDDLTLKLLYTAEQTNRYEDILHDIALYYKKRFQNSLKNFSSFIEPTIILFISIIVLWLVLAIMVPIWDLGTVL